MSAELDNNRCAVCGWPIAESVDKGCVRGNCSMRPFPTKAYDPERANQEYGKQLFEVSAPSLPSQAKAGPRELCAQCKANADWNEAGGYKELAEQCRQYCRNDHRELPAPAALSVEEYATQFKWAVARFSENVGAAEWVTKTQALEFARHFAGAVGQPPQDVEALAAKCADLASCCMEANAREIYIRVWTPKFAELLRPSLPSESPAAPELTPETRDAFMHEYQLSVWKCSACDVQYMMSIAPAFCPQCGVDHGKEDEPAAPEVPFSLPLRAHPRFFTDICDANGDQVLQIGSNPSTERRDYIISAVNSHEELKRELEQWTKWGVVEVAVRNPQVADYCNHWEGRADAAEKSASDKEQELAMLTKDFGELAGKTESSERMNAELREALKKSLQLPNLATLSEERSSSHSHGSRAADRYGKKLAELESEIRAVIVKASQMAISGGNSDMAQIVTAEPLDLIFRQLLERLDAMTRLAEAVAKADAVDQLPGCRGRTFTENIHHSRAVLDRAEKAVRP